MPFPARQGQWRSSRPAAGMYRRRGAGDGVGAIGRRVVGPVHRQRSSVPLQAAGNAPTGDVIVQALVAWEVDRVLGMLGLMGESEPWGVAHSISISSVSPVDPARPYSRDIGLCRLPFCRGGQANREGFDIFSKRRTRVARPDRAGLRVMRRFGQPGMPSASTSTSRSDSHRDA